MRMNLSEALNSINFTKQNLIRNADGSINHTEARTFPSFVAQRSLSYHLDALPWVAHMQALQSPEHNMSEAMQYEFLLHTIPKGKRFAKWVKPKNEKLLQQIMEDYGVNIEVAKGYVQLLSHKDINDLMLERGGVV